VTSTAAPKVADVQPPSLDRLVAAIELVLTDDPRAPHDSLVVAQPITPAQSKCVANEIVWNRTINPLPEPDLTLGADPLGPLCTDLRVDDQDARP
jgi:hypothetical protein